MQRRAILLAAFLLTAPLVLAGCASLPNADYDAPPTALGPSDGAGEGLPAAPETIEARSGEGTLEVFRPRPRSRCESPPPV